MHTTATPIRSAACLLAFFLLMPVLMLAQPLAYGSPEKLGQYAVGVSTTEFTDMDRAGGPRSLKVEIWYPADADNKGLNTLLDFYEAGTHPQLLQLVNMALKTDLVEASKRFKNVAIRDAQVATGKFPLIIFSHGNGGMRSQTPWYTEHLASHGFIVIAPDHTHNSLATTNDHVLVPMDNSDAGRAQSALERPQDISFLIDQMSRWHRGADSRFLGKLDLDNIGVTGHSFGGFTSTWMPDHDDRITAIAPLAGSAPNTSPTKIPLMTVMASEDATMKLKGNAVIRKHYADAVGPKYMVDFLNAGHFSFSIVELFNPNFGDGIGQGKRITNGEAISYLAMDEVIRLTNGYTTAFFSKYLKHNNTFDDYLKSNQSPSQLLYRHKN